MRFRGTIAALVLIAAGCSLSDSSAYLSVSDIAAQEPSHLGQVRLACRGEYTEHVADAPVLIDDFVADPLVTMTAAMESVHAPAPASVQAMANFWLAVDDTGGVYGGVEPASTVSFGGFITVCGDW